MIPVFRDVADEREAQGDAEGRLDDPPLGPGVGGRRHLPQPLRDSSGHPQALHPRCLHRQRNRTQ